MSEKELIEQFLAAVREAFLDINPERVYPDDEAAYLIGFRGEHRAREIRELPIPQVPITQGGRKVGYQGKDLIAYIERRKRVPRRPSKKTEAA